MVLSPPHHASGRGHSRQVRPNWSVQIGEMLGTAQCHTYSLKIWGSKVVNGTGWWGSDQKDQHGPPRLLSELKMLQQGARKWGPGLLSPELCLQTGALLHNSLKVECQQKGRRDDGDKALHLAAIGHSPCESQCCVSHHCGRKFQFWMESSLYPLLPPLPPRAARILGLVLCE